MSSADKTRLGGSRSVPLAAAARLASFAISYLLARTPVSGRLYPFGTAYIAALGSGNMFAATLGAVLSGVLLGERLRIAAAALAAAAVRWTLSELRALNSKPLYPAAAAFFACLAGGLADRDVRGGLLIGALLPLLCEALISAVCAYFFSVCFGCLRSSLFTRGGRTEGRGSLGRSMSAAVRRTVAAVRRMTEADALSCLFTACVFSLPLCRVTVGGFSPFSVVLLVLAAAATRALPPPEACMCGICAGLALSLSSGNTAYLGMIAPAALLASLFSRFPRIVSASVFSAVCAALSLYTGSIDVYFLIQSALAGAFAAAVPDIRAFSLRAAPDLPERPVKAVPRVPAEYLSAVWARALSARLRASARGVSDISAQVMEASSRLDAIDAACSPQSMTRRAADICGSCGISSYCWGVQREKTAADIRSACAMLSKGRDLSDNILPRCPRRAELLGALELRHAENAERARVTRRVSRVRSAAAGMLGCVSELVLGMSRRVDNAVPGETDVPPDVGQAVREITWRSGIGGSDVYISTGKGGRLRVTLDLSPNGVPDGLSSTEPASRDMPRDSSSTDELSIDDAALDEMIFALSGALGYELDAAEDKRSGLLVIKRSAPLRAVYGACRRARDGSLLCGDAYEALTLDSGHAVFILSDGMGTGGRAAIDAAMTCGLLRQLLCAGFEPEGAMGMVNYALMLRAEDEPLSAVDCVSIDLFDGQTVLRKAGAAASYVRSGYVRGGTVRGVNVREIAPASLPLGIMERVDSAKVELSLREDDILLLVSDGVTGGGPTGWIKDILAGYDGGDMKALAERIVREAPGAGSDDVTALAIRIERRNLNEDALAKEGMKSLC